MTRERCGHSRSGRLATLLLIGVATFVLSCPAPATAYLYWANDDGVVRADLNGRGINTGFIPAVPAVTGLGLALTSQYIYISCGYKTIARADIDGANFNPEFITLFPTDDRQGFGGVIGSSLAISGSDIYWPVPGEGVIARSTLAGSEIEPRFIRTQPRVSEIAVGEGHVYWASEGVEGEIGRAALDGASVEPDLIKLAPNPIGRTIGLVVADGHIYWSAPSGHSIGRATLEGGHVEPNFIVDASGVVSSPTVAGGYIYWRMNEGRGTTSRAWIGRANINGTDPKPHFMNVTGKITGELVADSLGPGSAHRPRRSKPRR